MDFARPASANAQMVSDLRPLLQRCRDFMSYAIVPLPEDPPPPGPPTPAVLHKTEALTRVVKTFSDPILRNLITLSDIKILFEFITHHIFQDVPAVPDPSEHVHIYKTYVLENWVHIEITHYLLRLIMADTDNFSHVLTDDFVRSLVAQLQTPCLAEQHEVELDLLVLLEQYRSCRRLLLHLLLGKVVAYLDGATFLALSIGPILRMFLVYFLLTPGPIKQPNYLLFRAVFYPLFATDLAFHFAGVLGDVSALFQSRDAATAIWSLTYLSKHWPKTSTQKELVFLHQLMKLVPLLPTTMLEKIGPIIVKTLGPCLTSQSWEITFQAASFCFQDGFLHLFRPVPDLVTKTLISAARVACQHWNSQAREAGAALLEKLLAFQFASNRIARATSRKTVPTPAQIRWSDVFQMAAEADPSIDLRTVQEPPDPSVLPSSSL
jgi:serine/threonine-protein phosphatase 2A regulatory subunit B'